MFSAIITDIVGIIILLFTIYLASNNSLMTKAKAHRYVVASVLTLTVIFLEIDTVIFSQSTNPAMQIPNIIANVLGFSLTPIVPMSLAFLYDDSLSKRRIYLAIPLFLQAVICVCSAWTGWIFSVSANNEYSRGPLFFINALVSLYSFVILIYANHQSSKEYDHDQKLYLISLYLLILFGNVIQIMFPSILLIWVCVSISILLYYIFIRELQIKYDPVTNIRNRGTFESDIVEMQELDSVTIVVLDINNLKEINDSLGHVEGDKCLFDAADIINKSFENTGTVYRIGGDEFCVLCKQVEQSRLEEAFGLLKSLLAKREANHSIPFTIAYGYGVYKKAENDNIFDSFKKADFAMYAHKLHMKNRPDSECT